VPKSVRLPPPPPLLLLLLRLCAHRSLHTTVVEESSRELKHVISGLLRKVVCSPQTVADMRVKAKP